MTRTLRPGEIVLRDATRTFSVRADQARTLKGLILGTAAKGPRPVHALDGVTLHIEPGETVGMVGRNGAGKTSTLRVLAGIVPLQSGEVACGGRVVSLLELAAGFSRDFSGRENIYLQGALYGFAKAELEERIERIIAFSELAEFIDIPVKTYSSGMFVRLGFSIAAHLDADVLLIDEVLAVGDEAFQRKCLRRISERIAAGTTLVLVSHDAASVERVCQRVVVLDSGRIAFDGPTADGLAYYHRLMGTDHEQVPPPRSVDDVEITELELRDTSGRRCSVFHSGSPLQVAVTARAAEAAEAVEAAEAAEAGDAVEAAEAPGETALTLEVRTDDGALIHRTRTPLDFPPGSLTNLTFEVPELPLLGGEYAITVGGRTARFSVAHDPASEGVVDLRGAWRALSRIGDQP